MVHGPELHHHACAPADAASPVHLLSVFGGCNWPKCRLVQAYIHAAAHVDTYLTISHMADTSDYPHPCRPSGALVPSRHCVRRRKSSRTENLVGMRAFHLRPPGDATAWERVHKPLVGPSDTVQWDNVPELAGMKLLGSLEQPRPARQRVSGYAEHRAYKMCHARRATCDHIDRITCGHSRE